MTPKQAHKEFGKFITQMSNEIKKRNDWTGDRSEAWFNSDSAEYYTSETKKMEYLLSDLQMIFADHDFKINGL